MAAEIAGDPPAGIEVKARHQEDRIHVDIVDREEGVGIRDVAIFSTDHVGDSMSMGLGALYPRLGSDGNLTAYRTLSDGRALNTLYDEQGADRTFAQNEDGSWSLVIEGEPAQWGEG